MRVSASAAAQAPSYALSIRGGTIYDGSGKPPGVGDVAIKDDRIVAVGKVAGKAEREVAAGGMAVAPGFINMLSWATESLMADPKSQSDIRKGVTPEVMGEGWRRGPMKDRNGAVQGQRLSGGVDYGGGVYLTKKQSYDA